MRTNSILRFLFPLEQDHDLNFYLHDNRTMILNFYLHDNRTTRTATHVVKREPRRSVQSANQLITVIRCARSTTGFSIRNTVNDSRRSTVKGRNTTRRSPRRMRNRKGRRQKSWKQPMRKTEQRQRKKMKT